MQITITNVTEKWNFARIPPQKVKTAHITVIKEHDHGFTEFAGEVEVGDIVDLEEFTAE